MAEDRIDQSSRIRLLPSGLITRADFAEFVGRKVATVTQWAWLGRGPRPVMMNGRAFYRFEEAQRFAAGEWSEPAQ